MLSKRLARTLVTIVAACTWAAGTAGGHGPDSGLPVVAAPVSLQAPGILGTPPQYGVVRDCVGFGDPQRCFTPPDPATGRYLNVASFFDRRARSTSQHYFAKFYAPTGSGRVRINALGFHMFSTTANFRILPSAGVVRTPRQAPVLPTADQLTRLQVVPVPAEPRPNETCVEIPGGFTLEADEAAWLVLQFPTIPDTVSVGVLVDDDSMDEDCDFLTPNTGEYWYRPDPFRGPAFDWAITAYTEALAAAPDPPEPTWASVKQLYRESTVEPVPVKE